MLVGRIVVGPDDNGQRCAADIAIDVLRGLRLEQGRAWRATAGNCQSDRQCKEERAVVFAACGDDSETEAGKAVAVARRCWWRDAGSQVCVVVGVIHFRGLAGKLECHVSM